MKSIGITTHYYQSTNYGGLLQSYALYHILNERYRCQHISVKVGKASNELKKNILLKSAWILKKKLSNLDGLYRNKAMQKLFEGRISKTRVFREGIKHTDKITDSNFSRIMESFDILITGSDQVWNPSWYNQNFFLTRKNENQGSIAYAASIGKNNLNQDELDYMIPKLKGFDYISVREISAQALIQPYLEQKVKVTLDPTLLLNQNQWNEIAVSPLVSEPYIFVYLLGNNIEHRTIIKCIAKTLGFKIAFIPHVHLAYRKNDINFADIEVYDAGPAEFLGWIKNAEMVITDSFHGCVFSILFGRKFWALRRTPDSDPNNMNSRLYSLFDNLGIKNRMLENVDYDNKNTLLETIDYQNVGQSLGVLREDSIRWLKNALAQSNKN